MRLKPGELRVYYSMEWVPENLEDEINKVLKSCGFERWASSLNIEDNVRDLCYELDKGKLFGVMDIAKASEK